MGDTYVVPSEKLVKLSDEFYVTVRDGAEHVWTHIYKASYTTYEEARQASVKFMYARHKERYTGLRAKIEKWSSFSIA